MSDNLEGFICLTCHMRSSFDIIVKTSFHYLRRMILDGTVVHRLIAVTKLCIVVLRPVHTRRIKIIVEIVLQYFFVILCSLLKIIFTTVLLSIVCSLLFDTQLTVCMTKGKYSWQGKICPRFRQLSRLVLT